MNNKKMGNEEQGKAERREKRRDVKDAAMRYLEHRAHTEEEIKRHLQEKDYSQEEISSCMEFLLECHFLNDEDYCGRYIEYAAEKGRGPLRIRQELSQKGVAAELIEVGLEEKLSVEVQREMALLQARKVLGTPPPTEGDMEWEEGGCTYTEKELAKVGRRLSALGYKSSLVYEVLGRLRRESR